MSKAFTKEDEGVPEVPVAVRAQPGPRRYMTAEGWRALQEELATLLGEDAGAGGLAGLEAEARRRERERRARQVAATLEQVQVVTAESAPMGEVYFGAWVTLEDEEGAEVTWRLVGPDEADAKAGRLSVESPLARALLGLREGASVQVERPRGTVEYTVVRVAWSPPE
jgi:transcription elongation factor GreB